MKRSKRKYTVTTKVNRVKYIDTKGANDDKKEERGVNILSIAE